MAVVDFGGKGPMLVEKGPAARTSTLNSGFKKTTDRNDEHIKLAMMDMTL